jgi:hypothetical protein
MKETPDHSSDTRSTRRSGSVTTPVDAGLVGADPRHGRGRSWPPVTHAHSSGVRSALPISRLEAVSRRGRASPDSGTSKFPAEIMQSRRFTNSWNR